MAKVTDGPARKKIACFLPDLGGGGAERVMLSSIDDLIAEGHHVDLVVMRGDGPLTPLLSDAVRVFDLNAPQLRNALFPLIRYLKREKPDALHAQMWPATVIASLAHLVSRSKALLMLSDQVALSPHMTSKRELRALKWSVRMLYPRADYRVMCSAVAADDISTVAGIERASIEVVTNPITPPERLASTPKVETLWGDAKGRIINIGSFKGQKNQALLLHAFALSKARPEAKLMILGDGPLRGELEQLARELGIADRVIMPGFDLDPWPYLASADMFALSSDYEGFPLVLAEAMYAGLRLVSTDCVSGPAELTENGRYGQLVPCGDAVALASAIDAAWAHPHDPQSQRARAKAVAGQAQIRRYTELLTQNPNKPSQQ